MTIHHKWETWQTTRFLALTIAGFRAQPGGHRGGCQWAWFIQSSPEERWKLTKDGLAPSILCLNEALWFSKRQTKTSICFPLGRRAGSAWCSTLLLLRWLLLGIVLMAGVMGCFNSYGQWPSIRLCGLIQIFGKNQNQNSKHCLSNVTWKTKMKLRPRSKQVMDSFRVS